MSNVPEYQPAVSINRTIQPNPQPSRSFIPKSRRQAPATIAQTYFSVLPRWAITIDETVKAAKRPGDLFLDICIEIASVNSLPSIFSPAALLPGSQDPKEIAAILGDVISTTPAGSILVFGDDPSDHSLLTPHQFAASHIYLTGHPTRVATIYSATRLPSDFGHNGFNPELPSTREFAAFCRDKAIKLPNGLYHFLGDPLAVQYLRLTQRIDPARHMPITQNALNHLNTLRAISFRSGDRSAAADHDLYDTVKSDNRERLSHDLIPSHITSELSLRVWLDEAPTKARIKNATRTPKNVLENMITRIALKGQTVFNSIASSRAAATLCSTLQVPASFLQKIPQAQTYYREEYEEDLIYLADENEAETEIRLPRQDVAHAGIPVTNIRDTEILVPAIKAFIASARTVLTAKDGERSLTYAAFGVSSRGTDHYLAIDTAEEFVVVCWSETGQSLQTGFDVENILMQ